MEQHRGRVKQLKEVEFQCWTSQYLKLTHGLRDRLDVNKIQADQ